MLLYSTRYGQMVDNCKAYNEENSTYVQCAKKLERFVKDKLK